MLKYIFATLLVFVVALPVKPAFALAEKGDYVVILHGIKRTAKHMVTLADYLSEQGYDVINHDYPSTTYPLETLTEMTHKALLKKTPEDKPVHIIGYSMGGILARTIIHAHRPEHLGMVVQLASPNKGSEVADFLEDTWFYKRFFGPAGQQLITNQRAISHLFGVVDFNLGIIAGDRSMDPLSSLIIPGDDDGKVSLESTKLEGMKDYIIINASHLLFPRNKQVHEQTAYFLKHGMFKR